MIIFENETSMIIGLTYGANESYSYEENNEDSLLKDRTPNV